MRVSCEIWHSPLFFVWTNYEFMRAVRPRAWGHKGHDDLKTKHTGRTQIQTDTFKHKKYRNV